eukprot:m.66329 g.66329  ORF g.66329 m.66329 type:complete len:92 (-) comp13587_c0_seq3:264-539(-)
MWSLLACIVDMYADIIANLSTHGTQLLSLLLKTICYNKQMVALIEALPPSPPPPSSLGSLVCFLLFSSWRFPFSSLPLFSFVFHLFAVCIY